MKLYKVCADATFSTHSLQNSFGLSTQKNNAAAAHKNQETQRNPLLGSENQIEQTK